MADEETRAAESAQRPVEDAPAFVTETRILTMFRRFAENLGRTLHIPLQQRVGQLEQRMAEVEVKSTGINISANGLSIDGMQSMSAAIQKLNSTLGRPLRPVYDARGILVAASRDAGPLPENKLEQLEQRVAALERELAAHQRDAR